MKKLSLIIMSGILVISLSFLIYKIKDKEEYNNLKISLNGDSEISIKYKEDYTDLGASSTYKTKDISNMITKESNLDLEHVGTYKIKYVVNYKNKTKEVERIINVVDDLKPSLKLKDRDKEILTINSDYEEFGASAFDDYDGDISSKIEIDISNLDMTKPGNYKVIYKVKDSSGNEESTTREIIVTDKKAEKIPVLNYHFFYKTYDENCHEALCENVDTFRKQLDYLKDNGYYTVSINEFTKWMYGEIELPEKSILITVDDGAHGTSKINGNHLIPALEDYKMRATLFLITGWWDIENYRSEYLDVQSHTNDLHYEANCGHRSKVNCVSYDTLLADLKASIDVVENTDSFCFPFYDYTESSINAVKEAGFKIAFVGGRRKASRSDDKYKIPRYPIYDTTSMDSFINMIS